MMMLEAFKTYLSISSLSFERFSKNFWRKMILTQVHYYRFSYALQYYTICFIILYQKYGNDTYSRIAFKRKVLNNNTYSYTNAGYVNVRFEMKQNPWYDFHWSQSRFDYLHLQLWIMYKGFKPEYTKHCFYFLICNQQKEFI